MAFGRSNLRSVKNGAEAIGVTSLYASHRIFDQPDIVRSVSRNPDCFTMSDRELNK